MHREGDGEVEVDSDGEADADHNGEAERFRFRWRRFHFLLEAGPSSGPPPAASSLPRGGELNGLRELWRLSTAPGPRPPWRPLKAEIQKQSKTM